MSAGGYTFTEGTVEGWDLTDVNCTEGSDTELNGRTLSITLAEGEDVTCTFVNEQEEEEEELGSITIIKDAQPDDPQNFVFTATGEDVNNFTLDDDDNATYSDTKLFDDLSAGGYTFTEGTVEGWTLKDIECSTETGVTIDGAMVSITLGAGANVTCTFINEMEEDEEEDKVTLCHATGSETNPFIKITISVSGAFNGHLGSDHQNGEDIIPPFEFMGTTYSQNWDTEGQLLYRNDCVEEEEDGSITIVKDAQPNDAQNFSFTTTGSGLSNFTLDDDTDATLSNTKTFSDLGARTYTVTETETSGWSLKSIVCSQGANVNLSGHTLTIHLAKDQHVTCTFHNDKAIVILTGGGGGGQVLGSTTTKLANTGSATIPSYVAVVILLLLIAVTRLSTRKAKASNNWTHSEEAGSFTAFRSNVILVSVFASVIVKEIFTRAKDAFNSTLAGLRQLYSSPWSMPYEGFYRA